MNCFERDQAFWWNNGALRKSILEGIQIHNEQKPGWISGISRKYYKLSLNSEKNHNSFSIYFLFILIAVKIYLSKVYLLTKRKNAEN